MLPTSGDFYSILDSFHRLWLYVFQTRNVQLLLYSKGPSSSHHSSLLTLPEKCFLYTKLKLTKKESLFSLKTRDTELKIAGEL